MSPGRPSPPGSLRRDTSLVLAALLSLWTVVALAAWLARSFSYDKWDNFEYLTPTLLEAHGRLLDGHFPLWNPHQHLGEPFLGNGQPGVFYLPYTAAAAAARAASRPQDVLLYVALFHLSLGLVGSIALLRLLGVGPGLAWGGALSLACGGYLSLLSTIWTCVGAHSCWLPWALYGGLSALGIGKSDGRGGGARTLWLPLALAMASAVGHPQFWLYLVLWVSLLAVLLGVVARSGRGDWTRFSLLLAAGCLLSTPTLLPILLTSRFSVREAALPLPEFLRSSVAPEHLLSLLLPTFATPRTYLVQRGCLSFFQGSWVAMVLGGQIVSLGAASILRARAASPPPSARAPTERFFLASLFTGLLFSLLALGSYGGLYRLTYGIPIWSSLRWPFKFLQFANAALGMAAVLGLQAMRGGPAPIPARRSSTGWFLACGAGAAAAAVLLAPGGMDGPLAAGFVVLAGLFSLLLAMPPAGWFTPAFLVLCSLSALLTQVAAHDAGLKAYAEPVGGFGPDYFHIDPADRILPVSAYRDEPIMQPLGLFQSATINGYDSVTGCTTHLAPIWYKHLIPSNELGVLPAAAYPRLLASHFLKTLDVRYALVHNQDALGRSLLEGAGFQPRTRGAVSSVYEQEGFLPRIYFAERAVPFAEPAFQAGLLDNQATLRTAYVSGLERESQLPRAEVLEYRSEERGLSATVSAPQGGLLVFSSTYYPDWQVRIDGRESDAVMVNGLVTGAWVPPGARRVEFVFGWEALRLSLPFAGAGILLLVVLVRRRGD